MQQHGTVSTSGNKTHHLHSCVSICLFFVLTSLFFSCTQDELDETKPIIVSVHPEQGANNISVPEYIEILFSKKMDVNSIRSFLKVFNVTNNNSQLTGEIEYNSETHTARYRPVGTLFQEGFEYRVEIQLDFNTGGVQDTSGNLLEESEPGIYAWNFSTKSPADIIKTYSPVPGATEVSVSPPVDIRIEFKQPLLKPNLHANDWFVVSTNGNKISGDAKYTEQENEWFAVFTPSEPYSRITNYTVTIDINDINENTIVNSVWSFITKDGDWDSIGTKIREEFQRGCDVKIDEVGNVLVVTDDSATGVGLELIADRFIVGSGWETINASGPDILPTGKKIATNSFGTALIASEFNDNIIVSFVHSRYSPIQAPGSLQITNNLESEFSDAPDVAISDFRRALVVWRQKQSLTNEMLWSINASGYSVQNGWTTAETICSAYCQTPVIAMNSQGDAGVIYLKRRGGAGLTFTLNAVNFSTSRTPSWQQEINLDELTPASVNSTEPSIDISDNGDIIVVWRQVIDTFQYIQSVRYSSELMEWDHDENGIKYTTLRTRNGLNVSNPIVRMDKIGNALVMWIEGGSEIYSIKYNNGAGGWDRETDLGPLILQTLNSQGVQNILYLNLSVNDKGNAIAVWGSPNIGIFQNRYVSGIGWKDVSGLLDIGDISNTTILPSVDLNNNEQAWAVWKQTGCLQIGGDNGSCLIGKKFE